MPRYAENTSVPVERSKAEIERTLHRYGASEYITGWNANQAMVGFKMKDRYVKFLLPMPRKEDEQFLLTPTGRERSPTQQHQAWEQACRQSWRALALAIKAKLECVESGISSFEQEFMAHIVLPNGKTVGEEVLPKVAAAYDSGKVQPLLPDLR